jgi:glycosyltransferase involved in cell wall biosynthesis
MTRVAYVIGTYPRLTTTFIDREIQMLRSRGVDVGVFSIRRPDAPLSPDQRRLGSEVTYLLPTTTRAVVMAHLRAATRPAYWRVLLRLLARPHPSLRDRALTVAHVAEGVLAAAAMRSSPWDRVHAHFVDRAAVVALTAARLQRLPYSATAHAADIYVSPVLLEDKLHEADFVATCTAYNRAHLSAVAPGLAPDRLVLAHHGLDLERYDPPARAHTEHPLVLAVGQLRAKKGFADLLTACRLLVDRGRQVRCTIVGEGPERPRLERRIAELELGAHVTMAGALPHEQVLDWYRRAEVFTLPCTTGDDGDRDGLPNVILEAMAMELPVVSTDTSAVPEAVEHGTTGLLVRPGDPAGLADALDALIGDSELRGRMGRAGRKVVLERFDIATNTSTLQRLLTRTA